MVRAVLNNDTNLGFIIDNFNRNTNFETQDPSNSRIYMVTTDTGAGTALNNLMAHPFINAIRLVKVETNTIIYQLNDVYGTISSIDQTLIDDKIVTSINIHIAATDNSEPNVELHDDEIETP